MIIEGHELCEQLDSFPLGTRFKCVGHWDKSSYYYEGLVYVVMEDLIYGGKSLSLTEGVYNHKNYLQRNSRGNGYSGTWQLISSIEGKELEDYL